MKLTQKMHNVASVLVESHYGDIRLDVDFLVRKFVEAQNEKVRTKSSHLITNPDYCKPQRFLWTLRVTGSHIYHGDTAEAGLFGSDYYAVEHMFHDSVICFDVVVTHLSHGDAEYRGCLPEGTLIPLSQYEINHRLGLLKAHERLATA